MELGEKQARWDATTDVLVVGYGGAGAAAAIAAHDAGAEVLIIEKAPFGGGNTACCLGNMRLANNVADGIAYYRALSFGTVSDEDLIRAFAEAMVGMPEELKAWGIELKLIQRNTPAFPTLPGAQSIDQWTTGPGAKVFPVLDENVTDRGITVRYETPANELVRDPSTGAVRGAVAASTKGEQRIRANRAVILATGGYENNVEMQGYYHFPGLTLYPFGTPYNTGDGIKMAAAVGADQWHFVSTEFLGVAIKAPTEACGAAFAFLNTSGSFIFVNRYGRRFINESKRLTHRKDPIEFTFFDHEQATYPNMPSFCVFDEKQRTKGPLYTLAKTTVGYPSWQGIDEWSRDNSAEIEKGWIVQAGNLEELAERIGADAAGLSDTVDRYNAQCGGQEAREFGRPADNMEPLEGPPFYAFELCLSIVNTQGGPKHNRLAQTLDMKGDPIPRLYTPGELGSFFGHLYQGGSNYPEAIAFGRIAGENAAAEAPW